MATGTPVVVFVINAGPVDLSWAKDNVAAIISAGYGAGVIVVRCGWVRWGGVSSELNRGLAGCVVAFSRS